MKLKFLGRGAALNPKEGSNSAYYREGNKVLILDVGESIFSRLIEKNALEGAEEIYAVLTHTHSDHCGSLGTLIHYTNARLHLPVHLVLEDSLGYLPDLNVMLHAFQILDRMICRITPEQLAERFEGFDKMTFVPTRHVEELSCYGLRFDTKDGIVYYTGDSRDVELLQQLYDTGKLVHVYTDTHNDNRPVSVHMPLDRLKEVFPEKFRKNVTCMHFGSDEVMREAKEAGFDIAELL